jgi:S-adenosylmethionine decarboxylase
MTGGTEWLVDAFDCDPLRLSNPAPLRELSAAIIATLELHVVGEPLVHRFGEPGGVTGLYLLSESHLAWHTYPESRLCTFNLYCCRARSELDWSALLGAALGARRVRVETVLRGLGSSPPPGSGT